MSGLPRKVLFVRLGAIGDVVNALVVAAALEDCDPSIEIGWAVHDEARALVDGHPSIDHVHHWPRRAEAAARRALVAEIRAVGYDAACDLQRLAKSARLVKQSGAPRRIGFPRSECKEWSWLWTNEKVARGPGRHRVDAYLDVARHLGVPDPAPLWKLPPHPAAERWAAEKVAELGGPPMLLNLGATKPANRWHPNQFGELARLASEAFPDVPRALIGSQADGPGALRALSMTKERHQLANLVGKTSLPELWELLRRARVVVTCDTGPMHLARAVGAPLVVLVGGSDPEVTGPYRPGACGAELVRVPPACAPCSRRECNRPRHDCMEDILPERVLAAIGAVLGRSAASAG